MWTHCFYLKYYCRRMPTAKALHKIHANDDAQDMRNMGGLRSAMPITFLTFLVSTIAISGIPGFSGFFSKDEILWMAFANPYHGNLNIVLWEHFIDIQFSSFMVSSRFSNFIYDCFWFLPTSLHSGFTDQLPTTQHPRT